MLLRLSRLFCARSALPASPSTHSVVVPGERSALVGGLDGPCTVNRLLQARLSKVSDRTGARESQPNQTIRTAVPTIT